MKEKLTKSNGITLIALVLTIVVILIIASISISIIFGQNGVVKRAEEAKFLYKKGLYIEQTKIAILEVQTAKEIGEDVDEAFIQSLQYKLKGRQTASMITGNIYPRERMGRRCNNV